MISLTNNRFQKSTHRDTLATISTQTSIFNNIFECINAIRKPRLKPTYKL